MHMSPPCIRTGVLKNQGSKFAIPDLVLGDIAVPLLDVYESSEKISILNQFKIGGGGGLTGCQV